MASRAQQARDVEDLLREAAGIEKVKREWTLTHERVTIVVKSGLIPLDGMFRWALPGNFNITIAYNVNSIELIDNDWHVLYRIGIV